MRLAVRHPKAMHREGVHQFVGYEAAHHAAQRQGVGAHPTKRRMRRKPAHITAKRTANHTVNRRISVHAKVAQTALKLRRQSANGGANIGGEQAIARAHLNHGEVRRFAHRAPHAEQLSRQQCAECGMRRRTCVVIARCAKGLFACVVAVGGMIQCRPHEFGECDAALPPDTLSYRPFRRRHFSSYHVLASYLAGIVFRHRILALRFGYCGISMAFSRSVLPQC